jgi:hypothetical protein
MTAAEFYHQQSTEFERANRARSKPNLNVGKVWVEENAMTRIGALCFIRKPKREDHHERAAERFKDAYEALYGSGVPALDNSRPVVDRSPVAHDSGMAAKLDRGNDMIALVSGFPLHNIKAILSPEAVDRLVACVVLGIPCGEGRHWRDREKAIDALLGDLDALCVHWQL